MEVIKKGRKQKGWSKEFTCTSKGNGGGGCGAVLLVSQNDIYRTSSTDYGGDTEHFTTFCCIECGVETDVSVPISPLGKKPTEAEKRAYTKHAKFLPEAD
jgi:hypothetical protein